VRTLPRAGRGDPYCLMGFGHRVYKSYDPRANVLRQRWDHLSRPEATPAMFTPVFAVARTVGWVAHWNEMIGDPETRLFRPRQLYAGPGERAVVPISERAPHAPLVG